MVYGPNSQDLLLRSQILTGAQVTFAVKQGANASLRELFAFPVISDAFVR